jgi:tetratricopeptide (TPR) repeat protein
MQIKCSSCGASQNYIEGTECTFCGSLITANSEVSKRIEKLNSNGNLFRLAEVAFEGGNFEEAILYYNKCLEIDPDFFEAWYKKGLSIIQTSTVGNFKSTQGLASINEAINNCPNHLLFKKRIKIDLIPVVVNYLYVSLKHYTDFRSLTGSATEFAEKINRTNSVIEFIINNSELSLREIEKLYNTYKDVTKKTQMAQIGGTNKSEPGIPIGFAYKHLLYMEEKLRGLWEIKSPTTAPSKRFCFIATAAMGDYNHPVVMDLRLFRDNWLLKREWGVRFTNWYYKHGPKAANVIAKSNLLKKITYYTIVKPLQLITKKFN